ncbi:tetratricopeptide repeat protein [Alkaliphilus peptidifermentans]|uniref:Tetratricopeptide repeat-containing protein n=1 Tax=Alkaliphilus peptidifermentans DSM 18978 TaxID=1120976 RepID=A0A1G5KC46_9FIRM|nr:tetratricopeptide repeat protein [Alkaliphilus peptidifermentans]SCY97529.1 Tetratricopeptide repeat-containing protein [Alkaliphilus peptidifermentans DSM 18978]
MEFLIEPYLKEKSQELSFVQLKGDAEVGVENYQLPSEGLDVPILTEELAENIKKKRPDEVLTVAAIVRGMIHTIGIDSNFKYLEEYIKFLYAFDANIEAYIMYQGVKYIDSNKPIESIIFFKALVTINPQNPKGLLNYAAAVANYGNEYLKSGHKQSKAFHKEAKEKFEELLNRGIEEPLIYYHLAYLYRYEKQFIKSRKMGEIYLNVSDEELLKDNVIVLLREIKDLALYEEGYEAILSGKPQIGVPILEELLEEYKEWWNLYFFVGLGNRLLGNYKEAINSFEQVLELEEDQLDSLVELGLCYSSINDLQEAIDYFTRALRIGGDNSEILCNLAMVYMETGCLLEAEEIIRRSLELNPDDEITQLCFKKLQSQLKITNN